MLSQHVVGIAASPHRLTRVARAVLQWEGLSAAIVVYDVSDRDSFNACTKWLARAQAVRRTTHPIGAFTPTARLAGRARSSCCPTRPRAGVLIANKVDLREAGRAVVTTEEGMELARANGLEYFETAAVRWRMNASVFRPRCPLTPRVHNAPPTVIQASGTDVDAPFHFVADAFSRKYSERVRAVEHGAI